MKCLASILLLALSSVAVPAQPAVALDAQQQRALNVFVSNFAEARLESFERGEFSNQARLRFGFRHTAINRERFFEWQPDGQIRLAARHIADPAMKYFGLPVEHEDIYEDGYRLARYARGQYHFGWGDGEVYPFGHVTRLVDLGGDEYRADVQVYQAFHDMDTPYDGTEASWRRRGIDFERIGRRRAEIRRVGDRYVLLSWQAVG